MAAMVKIPPELWRPDLLPRVAAYLVAQVAPGKDKARALKHWAAWMKVKLTAEMLQRVEASGLEVAPAYKLPLV